MDWRLKLCCLPAEKSAGGSNAFCRSACSMPNLAHTHTHTHLASWHKDVPNPSSFERSRHKHQSLLEVRSELRADTPMIVNGMQWSSFSVELLHIKPELGLGHQTNSINKEPTSVLVIVRRLHRAACTAQHRRVERKGCQVHHWNVQCKPPVPSRIKQKTELN